VTDKGREFIVADGRAYAVERADGEYRIIDPANRSRPSYRVEFNPHAQEWGIRLTLRAGADHPPADDHANPHNPAAQGNQQHPQNVPPWLQPIPPHQQAQAPMGAADIANNGQGQVFLAQAGNIELNANLIAGGHDQAHGATRGG
jgi:hypothetical protein